MSYCPFLLFEHLSYFIDVLADLEGQELMGLLLVASHMSKDVLELCGRNIDMHIPNGDIVYKILILQVAFSIDVGLLGLDIMVTFPFYFLLEKCKPMPLSSSFGLCVFAFVRNFSIAYLMPWKYLDCLKRLKLHIPVSEEFTKEVHLFLVNVETTMYSMTKGILVATGSSKFIYFLPSVVSLNEIVTIKVCDTGNLHDYVNLLVVLEEMGKRVVQIRNTITLEGSSKSSSKIKLYLADCLADVICDLHCQSLSLKDISMLTGKGVISEDVFPLECDRKFDQYTYEVFIIRYEVEEMQATVQLVTLLHYSFQFIHKPYWINTHQLETLWCCAKFPFECGNYMDITEGLFQYDRCSSALWGKCSQRYCL